MTSTFVCTRSSQTQCRGQRSGHRIGAQEIMHIRGMWWLSALHHMVVIHRRHVRFDVALVSAGQIMQLGHTYIEPSCRKQIGRVLGIRGNQVSIPLS